MADAFPVHANRLVANCLDVPPGALAWRIRGVRGKTAGTGGHFTGAEAAPDCSQLHRLPG